MTKSTIDREKFLPQAVEEFNSYHDEFFCSTPD